MKRFWLDWTQTLQRCPYFRCVAFDRLQTVLRTGVDVEPSSHHIYVTNSYEKALEYGDTQKIMLVYDPEHLRKTCFEVPVTTPPNEPQALSVTFPTRLTSVDGTTHLFSRLSEDDTALGTGYENEYGRWIPGDPLDALKAMILIGQYSDDEIQRVSAFLPPGLTKTN